jgi:hypothetical protein
MDIEKMWRLHRAKEQRVRILHGEITFRWHDSRVVRISEYKARKARQVVWENESTAEPSAVGGPGLGTEAAAAPWICK